MKYKKTVSSTIFDTFNTIFLALLVLVFLYPIWYVFSASISSLDAVATDRITFYPIGFSIKAYGDVLKDSSILISYKNTIVYAAVYTILSLVLTAMSAYPLTSRNFVGKKFFNFFFIIPMFLNAGMIPFFLIVKSLGLLNNIMSIVLPTAVTGFNLIIFRTFFEGLPYELRESAMVDGAGQFRTLFQIIWPLATPIIATVALFSIVAQWNNFREPLLFLDDAKTWPIQLTLRRLIINNEMTGSDMMQNANIATQDTSINRVGYYEALKMAAIMISIGPIVLVYPFVQRYFEKGMLLGSVKG
jgi:putative aldouronate transport system permease protein